MFLVSQSINARHAFFTRNGGVSEGAFAYLNCGRGSGEDLEKVNANRLFVMKAVGGTQLVTPHQTHSDVAVVVNGEIDVQADALVTNTKGIAIGVLTADCAPVLLEDAHRGIIGVAHAGWRGARFGIISSVVRAMKNLGAEDICAVVGPCIHQQSYEVSQEFFDTFAGENVANQQHFIRGQSDGKYLFDLPRYVESKLIKNGVTKVEIIMEDTLPQPEKFYSFRRTTLAGEKQYGRQISVICL